MLNKKELVFMFFSFLLAISIYLWRPFQLVIVSGESMYPTLHNNQFLIMYKGKYDYDDVISFNATEAWTDSETKGSYIKRIKGLPGDIIRIEDDKLYVNYKEVLSFEDKLENNVGNVEYVLGKDEYFVVGDNVGKSNDSLYRLLNNFEVFVVKEMYIEYKTTIKEKSNE